MSTAESAGEGKTDGSIFEGTKFWISHRIPDRANVIALVKGHGGLVEAYDKRADILIADHARRDAPPNSFSWRLITESSKAGRFLEKEPYRIGRQPTEPRPVASQEPTRSRRVPFSADDDALLAAWVGRSTQKSGNKIYQELEAAHPHHTWHSWRDRWLKHVRLLPADVLDRMVHSSSLNEPVPAPSEPNRQAATAGLRPQRQRSSPRTQQPPPQSSQALRRSSPGQREGSPGFNDDDDAVLERYVKTMVEAGERWNSISVYEELAKQHPRHSAESWKQRFAELWRANRVNTKNWNSTNRFPSDQPGPPPPTRSEPRGQNGDTPLTEENKSRHPHAMPSAQKPLPETDDPKGTFYRRYAAWIDLEARTGRTRQVMIWHRIQGRKFELWDLYEAVLAQECPVDDVKWELVAQQMGFTETGPHTSKALEACWDKFLSKFREETAGFDDFSRSVNTDDSGESTEGTDDTSGDDVSEEEGTSQEEGISGSEDDPTPRRTQPSPILSTPSCPRSSHIKRRLDRGVEIPASSPSQARPGPVYGANNTPPSKRRRLDSRSESRRPGVDTDGDENIYDATPTRDPPVRREANRSSPLPVRHARPRSGIPRPSTAEHHNRRVNGTPVSGTTKGHTRWITATPGSGKARRHIRSASATPTRTPSPRLAPRRHGLPPAISPEPELDIDENDVHEEDNGDAVQATVNQFIREGYTRDMAVESLYWTSMIPSLSRRILPSLASGDGVPTDQAGVWTARDDEKLKMVDAGNINRPTENLTEHKRKQELIRVLEDLVRKHGKENVEARRRFLADVKEVGFIL